MNRFTFALLITGLTLWSTELFAVCYGYSGPGGPCCAGPGGPQHHAYSAPGIAGYTAPGLVPPGAPPLSNAKKPATGAAAKNPCPPNATATGAAGSASRLYPGRRVGGTPKCTPGALTTTVQTTDADQVNSILRELQNAGASDLVLKGVLQRSFDPNMADFLLADRACKRNKKAKRCPLEVSPLWAAQHPESSKLKVQDTPRPGIVRVEFRNPNTSRQIVHYYQIEQFAAGPVIRDIKLDYGLSIRTAAEMMY